MNKTTKPMRPVAKQLTDEQKTEQAARILAQKRESLFTGILYNLLQNSATLCETDPAGHDLVDYALGLADYAMQRLYNLPPMEDAK